MRTAIIWAGFLALPTVATASTGGATGPAVLGLVLLTPVALVAAAITWPFLPDRMKGRTFPARLRTWLWIACVYDLLLLAACAKACGLV